MYMDSEDSEILQQRLGKKLSLLILRRRILFLRPQRILTPLQIGVTMKGIKGWTQKVKALRQRRILGRWKAKSEGRAKETQLSKSQPAEKRRLQGLVSEKGKSQMTTRIDKGKKVRRWRRIPLIGQRWNLNKAMMMWALPPTDAQLQGRIGRWYRGNLTMPQPIWVLKGNLLEPRLKKMMRERSTWRSLLIQPWLSKVTQPGRIRRWMF